MNKETGALRTKNHDLKEEIDVLKEEIGSLQKLVNDLLKTTSQIKL